MTTPWTNNQGHGYHVGIFNWQKCFMLRWSIKHCFIEWAKLWSDSEPQNLLVSTRGGEESNCRSCRNVIPRSNLVTARPAAFNRHNLIHRDIFLPYQNCEKSPLDIWYELSSNPAILPLYLLFYFSDYPWYPGKMETHFRRVSETCQPYPAADDGGV